MADPITAMIATAVGSGIQAYGAYQGDKAQQAMANYQANVANTLAGVYNVRGEQQMAAGYQRAADVGLRTGAQVAGTEVRAAAGNIAGGSVRGVVGSELALGQLGQRRTIANAAEAAFGERLRGAEETATGGLKGMAALQYGEAAPIAAAGDIASGIGKVAGMGIQKSQVTDTSSVDSRWYS
jgi:hypothetical protein